MDEISVKQPVYSFMCPDCGMSDTELGHLVAVDDIHCVVCLIDEDRYVRLRRWVAEAAPAP